MSNFQKNRILSRFIYRKVKEIREKNPFESPVITIPISSISKSIIAVDATCIEFSNWNQAVKNFTKNLDIVNNTIDNEELFKHWFKLNILTYRTFLDYGTNLILCYDPFIPSKSKDQVRNERIKEKNEGKKRFYAIRKYLQYLNNKDFFEDLGRERGIEPSSEDKCDKQFEEQFHPLKNSDFNRSYISLYKELKDLAPNIVWRSKNEYLRMREELKNHLGFTNIDETQLLNSEDLTDSSLSGDAANEGGDKSEFALQTITRKPEIKISRQKLNLIVECSNEAEETCVQLANKGIADAVFSYDIDCLYLGCDIWIRQIIRKPHQVHNDPNSKKYLDKDKKFEHPHVSVYYSKLLLNKLGLNKQLLAFMSKVCDCEGSGYRYDPQTIYEYIKNFADKGSPRIESITNRQISSC